MSAETRTLAEWDNLLAEMESDLAWALNDNVAGLAAWTAPEDLGPIPDEFHDRARVLLTAQLAHAERLHRSQAALGRQISSIKLERSAHAPGPAAYLDVSA